MEIVFATYRKEDNEMKLFTIIFTIVIAITISVNAQISNSGFEIWTTTASYEDPTGWATVNSYSTGPFYAVTKSTDHYPVSVGSYSVRMENNTAFPNDVGRGIIMSGTFASAGGPAFPITGHPTSLTGYYKYAPLNGDTMFIIIHIFNHGTDVTGGQFTSTATASSWTPFTIPFSDVYTSADSGSMIIAAYNANGPDYVPHGNSILYVDNLNFDNLISSVKDRYPTPPNSASDILNLFSPSSSGISFSLPSNSTVSLKVLDMRGRELATLVNNERMSAGTHTKMLSARATSNGVYLYRLQAGSSTVAIRAFR
jgi:hypothetical protein